ncbi:MAG: YkvA family protein [Ignavibacteria bacterium]|jgi:uncharacterized membrane protein YkvA (DUF1232 family)
MDKKNNFPGSEIFDEIKTDSTKVSSDELSEVLDNENQIRKKASKLNFDKFSKLIRQLTLSLQMLKDYKTKAYSNIPWKTIALVVAAILYFINPFDIIPDFLPFLGYTDDAIAFAAIFKSAQTDLYDYCKWKGYNMEEYF